MKPAVPVFLPHQFYPRAALRHCAAPLTLLVLLSASPLAAQTDGAGFDNIIPEQPTNYITDSADRLTPEEEASLNTKLADFEKQSTNQIFAWVAPTLGGGSVEEVTLAAAERWKLGRKDRDNGVLLAIYLEERKMRIEVGYGLEGALPDAVAKRIIAEEIGPRLREGKFYEALDAGTTAMMAATRGEYTADESDTDESTAEAAAPEADAIDMARLASHAAWLGAGLALFLLACLLGAYTEDDSWKIDYTHIQSAADIKTSAVTLKAHTENRVINFIVHVVVYTVGGAIFFIGCAFVGALGVTALSTRDIFAADTTADIIAGALVAAATLVFLYKLIALMRTGTKSAQLLATLNDTVRIEKLKERYDGASVDLYLGRFAKVLETLRPAWLYAGPIAQLATNAEKVLSAPEKYLPYRADYLKERITPLLASKDWERFATIYDPAHVEQVREGFRKRMAKLEGADGFDAAAAGTLLRELESAVKGPDATLEYAVAKCLADQELVLGKADDWATWRKRHVAKKVDAHRELLERRLAEFRELDPADPAARKKVNNFYRTNVLPCLRDPAALFKPDRPPRPVHQSSGSSMRSSSSSGSSSSSSSWSSSSSSSRSSSSWSSSSSSSGSGRGGSFGGGGASGGW